MVERVEVQEGTLVVTGRIITTIMIAGSGCVPLVASPENPSILWRILGIILPLLQPLNLQGQFRHYAQ